MVIPDWTNSPFFFIEKAIGFFNISGVTSFQVPADERRTAVRRALEALRPGGTFLLVAHDSSNLTEGTGGPQDPAVLYTAGDVLDDLAGTAFEVVRAGRVPRAVTGEDEHGGTVDRTAWDALVRLVRR